MTCIYCAGRNRDQQMTLEHIWPRALGGDHTPELFRSNEVCRTCNSRTGQWVDGAFIRNFFIATERGTSALEFLDPSRPGPAPLTYFGFDTEFPSDSRQVCERWLGPAGEHIYHIHDQDEPRWETFAGGDMIRRSKKDPGRVYVFMTSPTEYWTITAMISITEKFYGIPRRCLTKIDGFPDRFLGFRFPGDPYESEQERIEAHWIDNRPGGTSVTHRLPVQIDFADRFMAKISIGFAHTILGAQASASPYCDELRHLLWSRNPSERENSTVRGTSFWNSDALAEIGRFTHWKGVWVIFFMQMQTTFGMFMCTPGGRHLSMLLSDDASTWRNDISEVLRHGAAYFVLPQRRRTFGPVPMMDIVSFRLNRRHNPELVELESMRTGLAALPPKLMNSEIRHSNG